MAVPINYYSPRLQQKLNKLVLHSATLLEGRVGYGKKTAVRFALSQENPAHIFWFTPRDEEKVGLSYQRLCATISIFDPQCGEALMKLGFPNRSNIHEVVAVIRSMHAVTHTWLVMDKMEVFQNHLATPIIKAFAELQSDTLHVVLIVDRLGDLGFFAEELASINYISEKDLLFRQPDIQALFEGNGLTLSPEEAEMIYRSTGGWTAAISSGLHAALNGLLWQHANTIEDLLQHLFWEKLYPVEKKYLFSLSCFDYLSSLQIHELFYDEGLLWSRVEKLIQRVPLIQYDEVNDCYIVHDLLQQFILKKLMTEPLERRKEIFLRCGQLYLSMGHQNRAIQCFYNGGDYEAILKTDLLHLEYTTIGDIPFIKIAKEIMEECPEEIKQRYPLSLLRLAYYFFSGGEQSWYERAMGEARFAILRSGNRHYQGEWHLMASLYDFPDLEKMEKHYHLAEHYLEYPSLIFTKDLPYLFGNPSPWLFFYATPGRGDDIGNIYTRVLETYGQLTNGHGAGADLLYRGEMALMQHDLSAARQYAYEAMYQAEKYENVTVGFGVALLLGLTAIMGADKEGFKEAIAYLGNKAGSYSFMQGSDNNRVMSEIVYGILNQLENHGKINAAGALPTPLRQPRFVKGILHLNQIWALEYSLAGEYAKTLGFLKHIEGQGPVIFNTTTQHFVHLGKALSYLALKKPEFAKNSLLKALKIAEPDGIRLPYLLVREPLQVLLEDPQVRKEFPRFVRRIEEGKLLFTLGDLGIECPKSPQKIDPALTPREKEVVLLAVRGLRNKEIAEQLHISQWTVKNHLQSVYAKLEIDRRSQLAKALELYG